MISRMPVRPETASVFHGETSLLLYHSVRSFSKHSLTNVAPKIKRGMDTADVVCEWNSIALDFGAGHVLGLVQP